MVIYEARHSRPTTSRANDCCLAVIRAVEDQGRAGG